MNIKTAIVTTLVAAMGLAAFTPTSASLGAAAPPVPVLNWQSCPGGFQCATARAPLDYRAPARREDQHRGDAAPGHRPGAPPRLAVRKRRRPNAQIDGFVAGYQAFPAGCGPGTT